jgi:XTP/dITP diphosphohydrolase
MNIREIIIATGNAGKVREIGEILSDFPVHLTSLRDHWDPMPEIPETGESFLENAFQKATWVYSQKQCWVLADDSGLEVDFLHGEPGVRSARYAGDGAGDGANNAKLLAMLKNAPTGKRTARFRCVMVLKMSGTDHCAAEGACDGRIGFAARGLGGFGYDPLFFPDGHVQTFAELSPEIKNSLSHRGKALQELKRKISELAL